MTRELEVETHFVIATLLGSYLDPRKNGGVPNVGVKKRRSGHLT